MFKRTNITSSLTKLLLYMKICKLIIIEKETDDILEVLSLVDRNQNEWDCVTFFCINWRRLPRSSPEELNMISVLDRWQQ